MNTYQDSIQLSADAMQNLNFAEEQNIKFTESLQGRINIFNNSLEKLSHQLLNSDMFKTLVDTGTDLVNTIAIIDDKFGLLNVVLGVTTVALVALKGEMIAIKAINFASFMGEIAFSINKIGVSSTAALLGLNPLTLAFGAMALAVGAGVISIVQYEKKMQELISTQKQLTSEINENYKQVSEIDTLINKLKNATKGTQEYYDITQQLNTVLPEAKDSIDAENDSLEKQVGIYESLIPLKEQYSQEKALEVLANEKSSLEQLNERLEEHKYQLEIDKKIRDEFLTALGDTTNMTGAQSAKLEELNKNVNEHKKEISDLETRIVSVQTATMVFNGTYDDFANAILNAKSKLEEFLFTLTTQKDIQDSVNFTYRDAMALFVETESMIESLTEDYSNLSFRKQDEAKSYIKSELEKTKSLLKQSQLRTRAYIHELNVQQQLVGVFDDAPMDDTLDSLLDLVDQYTYQVNVLEDELSSLTPSFDKVSSSSKSTTKELTEQEKAILELEAALKKLQTQEELAEDLESKNILRTEQINVLENLKKQVEEGSQEWLDYELAIKGVREEITSGLNEATKESIELLEEQNEALADESKLLEDQVKNILQEKIDLLDEQKSALEDELDAMKDKRKALEDEEKLQEKLIELEKAKQKLTNIQSERNVRVFRGGQFVFEADPRAIRAQQEEIAKIESDIQKDEVEKARDAEEDKLQARIDALDKQKSKVKSAMSAISNITSVELGKQNSYWNSWLNANSSILGSFRSDIAATIASIRALNVEQMNLGAQQSILEGGSGVVPKVNPAVLNNYKVPGGSILRDTGISGNQLLNTNLFNPQIPKIAPVSSGGSSMTFNGGMSFPNVKNGTDAKSFVDGLIQIARTKR